MTSFFLVEVYEPHPDGAGFARAVDGVREAAGSLAREGVHVRHVRSYVVPGDGAGEEAGARLVEERHPEEGEREDLHRQGAREPVRAVDRVLDRMALHGGS